MIKSPINNPQQISLFVEQYPWPDAIMKLDNLYVLEFNVFKLTNGPLSHYFYQLLKLSLGLLLLRTIIIAEDKGSRGQNDD